MLAVNLLARAFYADLYPNLHTDLQTGVQAGHTPPDAPSAEPHHRIVIVGNCVRMRASTDSGVRATGGDPPSIRVQVNGQMSTKK